MLARVQEILEQSKAAGWVLEPLAKELLNLYHVPTSRFVWAKTKEEALAGAKTIGYPLVAKVVSPDVIHKSDVGGVAVGLKNEDEVLAAFERMSTLPAFEGILLDEMGHGVELIVGSKQDSQFGTVVLCGIGGTSVEIYQDVALRMAPIDAETAQAALKSLKGHKLLEGYRGAEPVDWPGLGELISRFSQMAHELCEVVESIDLNPVLCNAKASTIADARIMLFR